MTREEAIKKVRQMSLPKETMEILEALAPELKESEDERITRAINNMLPFIPDEAYTNNGVTKEGVLNWLEKQKENPKSTDSIPSDCTSGAKCEDRWHKVGDSLPDNPREVLCKDEVGNYFIGRYYVGEGWEISNYDDEDKPHRLNPPVSKWIDFPSEKQKEQKDYRKLYEDIAQSEWFKKAYEGKSLGGDDEQKEQKPVEKEITLTSFEGTLNTFLFDFANSPIEDCEPKEYVKKHSAEILKAAYKELNAKLQQDIFEARQEGVRDGYEVAKAEQKPAEWSEDTIRRGIREVGLTQHQIDWLKKNVCPQPKQEWSKEDEENLGKLHRLLVICQGEKKFIPSDEYDKLDKWLKSLCPQPKQEWSEEDESMLNRIIETLSLPPIYDTKACAKMVSWLKSLPERFNLQSKQEWDEEDERNRDRALFYVCNYQKNNGDTDGSKECADWLKSLPKSPNLQPKQAISKDTEVLMAKLVNLLKSYRIGEETATALANRIADTYGAQRYMDGLCDGEKLHWKPSEEQILAIVEALKYLPNNKDEWMILNTLIAVLRKLM